MPGWILAPNLLRLAFEFQKGGRKATNAMALVRWLPPCTHFLMILHFFGVFRTLCAAMIESLLFDYAAPTRGITPSFGENDEVSPPRKTSPGTNFRVWRNNHKKIGITDAALASSRNIIIDWRRYYGVVYLYI